MPNALQSNPVTHVGKRGPLQAEQLSTGYLVVLLPGACGIAELDPWLC